MTVPSQSDLDKRKKALEQFNKHLDSEGRVTEKKLCSDLRSAIRQVWMKHPSKLSLLYKHTIPDMDDSTRTKWLIKCNECEQLFKLSDVEVNHKKGEHSLKTLDDLRGFAESILNVSHNDIEILCVSCHSIHTYSERYGVTLEEAKEMKNVIKKLNQKVTEQKKELLAAGFKKDQITNEDKRKECYIKLLRGEDGNNHSKN